MSLKVNEDIKRDRGGMYRPIREVDWGGLSNRNNNLYFRCFWTLLESYLWSRARLNTWFIGF
jgi:hypothetical protein